MNDINEARNERLRNISSAIADGFTTLKLAGHQVHIGGQPLFDYTSITIIPSFDCKICERWSAAKDCLWCDDEPISP